MLKGKSKHFNLIFRLVCFLLVVTSFTCVAFARYISSHTSPLPAPIAAMRASFTVQRSETGSAFHNSDYIVGNSIMNHPYVADFTLSNCNRDDLGNIIKDDPAQVDLACTAIFYIPKELAKVAAFQIMNAKVDQDGLTLEETQVTPIYTLADFLDTALNGTVTMPKATIAADTVSYEDYGMTIQYGADNEPTIKETFTVTMRGTSENRLAFEAKGSNTKDSTKNVTLSIEEKMLDADTTYIFQCFDRKVYDSHEELPTIKKPLTAKCVQQTAYYEIRLLHHGLLREGGSEDTDTFRMRLIPTKKLGNYGDLNSANNPDYSIESNMPFEKWYESKQAYNPTFDYNGDKNAGVEAATDDRGTYYKVTGTKAEADKPVVANQCIAKDFPIRINVIFTQASLAKPPKGETA